MILTRANALRFSWLSCLQRGCKRRRQTRGLNTQIPVDVPAVQSVERLEDRTLLAGTDWWFDFGTGASPVEAGHTEVTPGDIWQVTNPTFGWQDGKVVESRDRLGPDDTLRDYNLYRRVNGAGGNEVTFYAWVDPGFEYNVSLTAGSTANGRNFSYSVEGGGPTNVNVPAGAFQTDTHPNVAVSGDGVLEIVFNTGITSVGVNEIHIEGVPIPGEIHGYKFDDLNGNGIDDGEPRLAGVDIHLDDGINPTVTVATDASGEYWFTDLPPFFDYTVSETPPAGSVQTAGGSTIINLQSGEVVTPVEDPGLAFGNFFLGSIHGYKFEDLNNNGVDDGEPRLAGVEIILDDGINPPVSEFTDGSGEYWFAPLGPGTYTITEVAPPGSIQTTPDPAPIALMSGQVVTELDDPGLAFGNYFPPQPIWFDFGTAGSPVAAMSTQVTSADVFGVNPDFGWEAGKVIQERDRDTQPDDGLRDYNVYRRVNGAGGNQVTFFVEVDPSVDYDVTLTSGSDLNSRNFSYSIEGGASNNVNVPAGAYQTDTHLGVNVADGILEIVFTTGATSVGINELHIEPVLMMMPPPPPPPPTGLIVDNGDAGFAVVGPGFAPSMGEGFADDIHSAPLGDGVSVASWTFEGLSPGVPYEVSATWTPDADRATNAPFTVFDGVMPLLTVSLNQQLAPNDDTIAGADWEDIATVILTGDTLVVELSDLADGRVVADAVRVLELMI